VVLKFTAQFDVVDAAAGMVHDVAVTDVDGCRVADRDAEIQRPGGLRSNRD